MLTGALGPGVLRPLVAIFVIQTVLTTGAYSVSVVFPVAAGDLGFASESVGYFVAILYTVAMVTGLLAGTAVSRFGPTAVFQLLLLASVMGVSLLFASELWAAVVCAICFGLAAGPMNPTGSEVLGKVAPGKSRALVFSLKQCGTPAGGMLAGSALPPIILLYGWQEAMGLLAVACVVLILVSPFGGMDVTERSSAGRWFDGPQMLASLRNVIADGGVRAITLMGLCLGVIQLGVATYLVVFLWQEVGFSVERAGLIFAALHVSGIVSRLILGSVADRLIAARWLLVWIGVTLSLALILMTQLSADWPLLLVYSLVALVGASANGWVGLYFAELARLSPPGKLASVAGGSQFFTFGGLVIGPTLFGALLAVTGSYQWCFAFFAVVAALAAGGLALSKEEAPAGAGRAVG